MRYTLLLLLTTLLFSTQNTKLNTAHFAGGCFWGMEYHFEKMAGVTSVVSGFMENVTKNPSYQNLDAIPTAHVEAIEVTYNPKITNYQALSKHFFEIHDFTQTNGQGGDIGQAYLSVLFYNNTQERSDAYILINILNTKGYKVATTVQKRTQFFASPKYHQDYYERNGGTPYCHIYKKIF
jgi:methionine-S-sulfoxide reductase